MKFARGFKAALQSGDYPEEWCRAAIPYPALKKCLNKIRAELLGMGLDADSLHQLLTAQVVSAHGDQIPLARYKFDVSETHVRPYFTIFVDLEDGVVVDASLSPASRAFLQKQADLRRRAAASSDGSHGAQQDQQDPPKPKTDDGKPHDGPASSPDDVHTDDNADSCSSTSRCSSVPASRIRRVEVSLTADSEFFEIIFHDMAELERIGQAEQVAITAEVVQLGKEVTQVARPERKRRALLLPGSKGSKGGSSRSSQRYVSDLSRWRELFELYLDAQVFFSTRERDHGQPRTAAQASKQLDWFQEQVRSRGLLQQFQLPASMTAYKRFLLLNKRLYLNLRFRELNQTAQAKILKKFDKWTALGVSRTFPDALSRRHHHDLLIEGMARDVCARIADDIVAVVPRLQDYTCPVCLSLAWLPVRLRCRHVFCVRCVIRMQRDGRKLCPLCRDEVVMEADLTNLDEDLEKFLKLYFRRETKEKQRANEYERGVELFGEGYKPSSSCAVM